MDRMTLGGLGVAVVIAAAFFYWSRPRSAAEKLAALEKQERAQGGTLFQTELEGRHLALLLKDCKVFLLDATGKEVKRTLVLKTGFYLWFTGCTGQSIRTEGGFIRVMLRNQAFGAGGGNASGGEYRSRDGLAWEKFTGDRWLAVEKAQD